jgi:hypothetical protein
MFAAVVVPVTSSNAIFGLPELNVWYVDNGQVSNQNGDSSKPVFSSFSTH